MKDSLTALDPITGNTLWTRSDVSLAQPTSSATINIFSSWKCRRSDKPCRCTRASSALYDGATVKAPDFLECTSRPRIRLVGRDILVADQDKDATTLRLYDPLTGKDVWKQAFAPKSYVLRAEDGDLAGVVEPDGQVRVVDLTTRKEVLNAQQQNGSEISG